MAKIPVVRSNRVPVEGRPELSWDWSEIFVTIVWKLAPNGMVLTRRDAGRLPRDRVLIDDRSPDVITLKFVTVKEAMRLRDAINRVAKGRDYRVGVQPMMGRWQKLGIITLWKFRQMETRLTVADRDRVPKDKMLLMRGFHDDTEWLWVSREEAARIKKQEAEHEGHHILELVKPA